MYPDYFDVIKKPTTWETVLCAVDANHLSLQSYKVQCFCATLCSPCVSLHSVFFVFVFRCLFRGSLGTRALTFQTKVAASAWVNAPRAHCYVSRVPMCMLRRRFAAELRDETRAEVERLKARIARVGFHHYHKHARLCVDSVALVQVDKRYKKLMGFELEKEHAAAIERRSEEVRNLKRKDAMGGVLRRER